MTIRFIIFILSAFLIALSPAGSFAQDTTPSYAPASPEASVNQNGRDLLLSARLVPEGPTVEKGMVWRIFGDKADDDGRLPLVATASGGSAQFNLPTGAYFVHAAYGRAGGSKRVVLDRADVTESFVLEAGGLKLSAETNDQTIPNKDLRFSIYELEQDEDGERKLIALNVPGDRIIALNAGTYHVLSRYGTINATVRADLQVKAGELTQAVLQHRGASISLRLVSRPGGDPVANTSWSVFTQDGDAVFNSRSVSPSLVLSEGTYEATVLNGADTYRQTFRVEPGLNLRVEILIK